MFSNGSLSDSVLTGINNGSDLCLSLVAFHHLSDNLKKEERFNTPRYSFLLMFFFWSLIFCLCDLFFHFLFMFLFRSCTFVLWFTFLLWGNHFIHYLISSVLVYKSFFFFDTFSFSLERNIWILIGLFDTFSFSPKSQT